MYNSYYKYSTNLNCRIFWGRMLKQWGVSNEIATDILATAKECEMSPSVSVACILLNGQVRVPDLYISMKAFMFLTSVFFNKAKLSCIFLGSNMANCVFPALASKLFNDFGPNWVFYLTLISLLLTILCFLAMCALAKYRASK